MDLLKPKDGLFEEWIMLSRPNNYKIVSAKYVSTF